MLKNVKKNLSKIMAGVLALVLVASAIPSNMVAHVLAAGVQSFEVQLPVAISATVTMTNESNTEESHVVAAVNGVATFENVIDTDKSYALSVTGMEEYQDYTQNGVSGASGSVVVNGLTEKSTRTISFTEESVSKVYGDSSFSVTLTENVTGVLLYTSSNESVAMVDANGVVTICGAGVTEIKVTLAADGTYKSAEDTLSLTVEQAENALSYDVTAVNWVYKDVKTNPITVKEGAKGTVSYKSSDNNVATVDASTGEVEIKKPGSAIITASFIADADSNYKNSTATYSINAAQKENALQYESGEITKQYGETGTNQLSVPDDVTGTIKYESSNPNVATVNVTTGEYQIVGIGTSEIKATLAGDDNYKDCSVSYTLVGVRKEIELTINKTIKFGQDDPDLTADIKSAINAKLIANEKDDESVINRVASCITYSFGAVTEGEFRPVGTSEITFTYLDDTYYSFKKVTGTLAVENTFEAVKGTIYEVRNLNADQWGSTSKTVIIEVKDANKYQIAETATKNTEWKTQLVYKEECEMSQHSFYIHNKETKEVSLIKTEKFGIDNTIPAVNYFDFQVTNSESINTVIYYLSFGIFCKEEVKVTVTASDDASGVDSITLFYNDNEYGNLTVDEKNRATFTLKMEDFKALKTISARAIDKVGNNGDTTYLTKGVNTQDAQNSLLQLESDAADITIKADEDKTPYLEEKENNQIDVWYGSNVSFKVTVTDSGEGNSGIRSICATINGEKVPLAGFENESNDPVDTYTNQDENIVSNEEAYYFIGEPNKQISFDISTEFIKENRPADGKYIITVYAIDNAGNPSESKNIIINDNVTVDKIHIDDKNAPSVVQFQFNSETGIEGNGEESVSKETYGYFFQKETEVTVVAQDAAPSSGIKKIVFYTVDKDGQESPLEAEDVEGALASTGNNVTGTAKFKVKEGFKGQIYARAIDNAGHSPIDASKNPTYVNPNGVVIEDLDTHVKNSKTTVSLVTETEYVDNKGQKLYRDENVEGVKVKLYVEDTFSGIGSIEWDVTIPSEQEAVQKEKIAIDNYLTSTISKGDSIGDWEVEEVDKNLVTKISREISIDNDSNDIKVNLSFSDRAGNTSTAETLVFSIDRTAPVVTVEMEDNDDETHAGFFKADRKAIITVEERNFREKQVEFDVKVVDENGVEKKLEITPDFTPDEGADTIYQMKYTFKEEGDYTFDIKVTDAVEISTETNNVKFTNGNDDTDVAAICKNFTIDKKTPTVEVKYDNNYSENNNNYYKGVRVATITITEHNFDSARVEIANISSASDNNVAKTFPAHTEWVDNKNNTYTTTISYLDDAKYTFDIRITDKAGNVFDAYTAEEFYIDKTAPIIEFSGVADKSANKGTVAPVITYSDTNFNKDAVSITLSGVNNGKVTYSGSYQDIENGQRFTYSNFEQTQKVDDIYTLTVTLTDMAGNETRKSITFSANRFGSVYNLKEIESIIGKYLQKEQDIVFTETNVDSLEREGIALKLTKNGTPTDLVEGTDYTVEVSGGNGQWSVYKYTVKKSLFADDGKYSLAVYSKDAAGNVNENIDESKEAEISFGIDKTKPVVVPIDFESGVQYAVEEKTVTIEIKDNLVLQDVKIYLNDEEVEYTVDGEAYTFVIPESNSKQDVRVVVTDAAGNEYELPIEGFLVSTNIFARWYNNTPLFVGSIIGVVVLTLAIVIFILFGKKRKNEEK